MAATGFCTGYARETEFWRQAVSKEKDTLKEHKDISALQLGKAATFVGLGKSQFAARAMGGLRPKTGAARGSNNSVFDMKNDTKVRGYHGNLQRAQ